MLVEPSNMPRSKGAHRLVSRPLSAQLDYISVPQSAAAKADGTLQKAITSIPAYVAAASLFLCVCPRIKHRDYDEECDLASWSMRAWVSYSAALSQSCHRHLYLSCIPHMVCLFLGACAVPVGVVGSHAADADAGARARV